MKRTWILLAALFLGFLGVLMAVGLGDRGTVRIPQRATVPSAYEETTQPITQPPPSGAPTRPTETNPTNSTKPLETNPEKPTQPTATETLQPIRDPYDISAHRITPWDTECMAQIQSIRQKNGLPALKMEEKLCALAYIRAYEASTKWSHTRPDGREGETVLTDYGLSALVVTENLHAGQKGYPASGLLEDWLYGKDTKENLLQSDVTAMGLASYEAKGAVYTVALFVKK